MNDFTPFVGFIDELTCILRVTFGGIQLLSIISSYPFLRYCHMVYYTKFRFKFVNF